LEVLVLWINEIKDGICIGFARSSKDANLEVLIGFFQTFKDVRPNVYPCLDRFLKVWKVNFQNHIRVIGLIVIHTVD
jgi:hypothetical protein